MKTDGQVGGQKTPGTVFDVMRPGRAPASPNSRQVIMGHKAEAQHAQAAVSGIGEGQRPMAHKEKLDIKPTEQAPKPAAEHNGAAAAPDLPDKNTAASPIGQTQPPEPQGAPPLPTDSITPEQPEATVPAKPAIRLETKTIATGYESDRPVSATPPAEDQELLHGTAAPALSTQQDVVVSHHHHDRASMWSVLLLLLFIFLLAVIVVDIMLDVEIFDIPSLPRTDFL